MKESEQKSPKRDWPRCKNCGAMLVLNQEENAWECGNCGLVYDLDRGELIGPRVPLSGQEEQGGPGGQAQPHAQLSEKDFKNFLKYLDSPRGQGREAYKTAGKGVKEGMLDSWLKMGKPVPDTG